jgi:hypothetical protein
MTPFDFARFQFRVLKRAHYESFKMNTFDKQKKYEYAKG